MIDVGNQYQFVIRLPRFQAIWLGNARWKTVRIEQTVWSTCRKASAAIAPAVERTLGKGEVACSNHAGSTILCMLKNLKHPPIGEDDLACLNTGTANSQNRIADKNPLAFSAVTDTYIRTTRLFQTSRNDYFQSVRSFNCEERLFR